MQNKPLVPNLRFPEFHDAPEWELKPLCDVSDHLTEKVGDRRLIPVSISAGTGFVSQSEKFGRDISGAQYRNYIHLRRGDFSYNKGNSKRYPQGCVYELIRFEEAAVPSAFVSFRFRRDYVNGFFQSHFEKNSHGRELRKFITSGARSDGLLNVSPDEFFSIQLPVPRDIAEQQKIAECLTSLDELIAAEGRRLEALRTYKKGLMQNLFPREGETTPRLRFPEFDEGATKAVTLEQVVEVASGQIDPRQPPFCDLPHVGGENIESHTGRIWGVRTARELQLISGKYAFSKEDILYSKIRPVLNKVAAPDFEGICSADIYPIRPTTGELSRAYLFHVLQSEAFQTYATKHSDRGKIPKINREALLAYRLLIPQPPEQQRITECLGFLDALSTAQAKKFDALKTHKQGLLQGLFPSTEDA